jgi:hypothetical protein
MSYASKPRFHRKQLTARLVAGVFRCVFGRGLPGARGRGWGGPRPSLASNRAESSQATEGPSQRDFKFDLEAWTGWEVRSVGSRRGRARQGKRNNFARSSQCVSSTNSLGLPSRPGVQDRNIGTRRMCHLTTGSEPWKGYVPLGACSLDPLGIAPAVRAE